MKINVKNKGLIFNEIIKISNLLNLNGGKAFLIGGCVRDLICGLEHKIEDWDIEVFGISQKKIEQLLINNNYKILKVGKVFGVIKIKNFPIDISLPRLENKTGIKHKDFLITTQPFLSLKQAALRRDFTINAIFWDPIENTILDPCNGLKDLKNKKLKHIGIKFIEDPLRVLRAMQLASRLDLSIDITTINICKKMNIKGLSNERILKEWEKFILKSYKPSIGLNFLKECHWIRFYPELESIIGCKQDPIWHPEGDVWNHTLHAMDFFAKDLIQNNNHNYNKSEILAIGFSILCHDIGKPKTTFTDGQGRIRSFGHEVYGAKLASNFLKKIGMHNSKLCELIKKIIQFHMVPVDLYKQNVKDSAIRKLSNKVKRLDLLLKVVFADIRGSFNKNKDQIIDNIKKFYEQKMKQLNIENNEPIPLIMGRHLIKEGLNPSPLFGKIIKYCFNAQLNGEFSTEQDAKNFLYNYLHSNKLKLK